MQFEAVWALRAHLLHDALPISMSEMRVGIIFFGADKADHFGIGDLLASVMRNVLVVDDLEGGGAFDTLTFVAGVGTNALAEATKFVGV